MKINQQKNSQNDKTSLLITYKTALSAIIFL